MKILIRYAKSIQAKLKQLSITAAPISTRKVGIFDELDKSIAGLLNNRFHAGEIFEVLLDRQNSVPLNISLFGLNAEQMARIINYDLVFAGQEIKELHASLTTIFARLKNLSGATCIYGPVDTYIDWIVSTIDYRLTRISNKYKESFADCVWLNLSNGLVPPPARTILQVPFQWCETEKIKWLKFYAWLKLTELRQAGKSLKSFEDMLHRLIDCCPDDCSDAQGYYGNTDTSSRNLIEVTNNPKPTPFRKSEI
jgi:hypothetical protein